MLSRTARVAKVSPSDETRDLPASAIFGIAAATHRSLLEQFCLKVDLGAGEGDGDRAGLFC
jgi:hypothetical protein